MSAVHAGTMARVLPAAPCPASGFGEDRPYADLVGAIYAAALGDRAWPEVLSRLVAMLGARDARLIRMRLPPGDRGPAQARALGTGLASWRIHADLIWADVEGAGMVAALVVSRPPGLPCWSRGQALLMRRVGWHLGQALRLEHHLSGAARRPALPSETPRLSRRERDCLGAVARGATSKETARMLSLSVHTVDDHLRAAMAKLGVTKRAEAASLAVKFGLIEV